MHRACRKRYLRHKTDNKNRVDWAEDNTSAKNKKFADKKTETVIGEQVVGM